MLLISQSYPLSTEVVWYFPNSQYIERNVYNLLIISFVNTYQGAEMNRKGIDTRKEYNKKTKPKSYVCGHVL